MGRGIIKLEKGGESRYLEWSTIVDAPVTWGMTIEEFREYYREEYGAIGMRGLPDRIVRVEEKGTSFRYDDQLIDTIAHNRAGANESTISHDEIWKIYVDERPTDEGGE